MRPPSAPLTPTPRATGLSTSTRYAEHLLLLLLLVVEVMVVAVVVVVVVVAGVLLLLLLLSPPPLPPTASTDPRRISRSSQYSPWRAPGSAPVIDPCGVAGGRIPGQGPGGFGAGFQNTTNSKLGDLGSKTLKPRPTGVKWAAGSVVDVAWTLQVRENSSVELYGPYVAISPVMLRSSNAVDVAWTLQANHGGGYSCERACCCWRCCCCCCWRCCCWRCCCCCCSCCCRR